MSYTYTSQSLGCVFPDVCTFMQNFMFCMNSPSIQIIPQTMLFHKFHIIHSLSQSNYFRQVNSPKEPEDQLWEVDPVMGDPLKQQVWHFIRNECIKLLGKDYHKRQALSLVEPTKGEYDYMVTSKLYTTTHNYNLWHYYHYYYSDHYCIILTVCGLG